MFHSRVADVRARHRWKIKGYISINNLNTHLSYKQTDSKWNTHERILEELQLGSTSQTPDRSLPWSQAQQVESQDYTGM